MPEKINCLLVSNQNVMETFFNAEIINTIKSRVNLKLEINDYFPPEAYRDMLVSFKPEIIITGWGSPKLTRELYAEAPGVKVVLHTAGAINSIIDKDVMAQGVLVANWGDTAAPCIAEATLMMMIASLRKIPHFHNLLHFQKGWKDPAADIRGLFYQPVGIHGFGKISRALVKLLAPFSCRIQTYSPHVPDSILREYGVARAATLEELFSKNFVIAVLASKTKENFHIVNQKILSCMHNGAHLVLTGRGAVVDFEALTAELKTGRIFAALDVYEKEPLDVQSPLRGMDNCMLVPHCAGPTPDRHIDMGRNVLENVGRYLGGQPLLNRVDVDLYDLMT